MDGGTTDTYAYFMFQLSLAAARLKAIEQDARIRLIAHLDADGITACAILVKLLTAMKRPFSITIARQLTRDMIVDFGNEPYQHYIFADIGSYALSWIENSMMNKEAIIILDHHEPEKPVSPAANVLLINPACFGIDGDKEIAGAGVAYLFARQFDRGFTQFAHLAVIGAIAECQEWNGFVGLNQKILEEAVAAGTLEVHSSLRCLGFHSKPLHYLLEQSKDPYIPGVTGSEEGALALLEELGIASKQEEHWRTLADLSLVEVKTLVQGIVERRKDEREPTDVFGCTYLLPQEPVDSPLYDAREFATLLNGCGRLGKPMIGVSLCLGEREGILEALENQAAYTQELRQALRWFRLHRRSHHVVEEEGFIIINAEDVIRPTIIGTLMSMLAKSNRFSPGTLILGMARDYQNMTKVSLRIAGRSSEQVDARLILRDMMQAVNGEHGGHREAAGGIFPLSKEPYFLEIAKDALRRYAGEKIV